MTPVQTFDILPGFIINYANKNIYLDNGICKYATQDNIWIEHLNINPAWTTIESIILTILVTGAFMELPPDPMNGSIIISRNTALKNDIL